MKIYCPEFTLASSVIKNLAYTNHQITANIEESYFIIDFRKKYVKDSKVFAVSTNTYWLELNKLKSYNFFKEIDVKIPSYVISDKFTNIFPYVVKFITRSTLGIQTVVVKNEEDLTNLKLSESFFRNYKVLIQEYIQGREYTVTVLVGSKNWIRIGTAQDFKRLNDNDKGHNTFGMASISPVPSHKEVDTVIDKVINSLAKRGTPYKGFLSFQFIENGHDLWLLECNVRLCMPEFQSMSKLLDEKLFDRMYEATNNLYISPLNLKKINSVTINLIHENFPIGQKHEIIFPECKFEIITDSSNGKWCHNTFIAGINNCGNQQISHLTVEIYDYIETLDLKHIKYRKDIK
jgi:phosphoribosylamine--glycine ligase